MGRSRKQLHGAPASSPSPGANQEKTRQAGTSHERHKRDREDRRVIVARKQEAAAKRRGLCRFSWKVMGKRVRCVLAKGHTDPHTPQVDAAA